MSEKKNIALFFEITSDAQLYNLFYFTSFSVQVFTYNIIQFATELSSHMYRVIDANKSASYAVRYASASQSHWKIAREKANVPPFSSHK